MQPITIITEQVRRLQQERENYNIDQRIQPNVEGEKESLEKWWTWEKAWDRE